MEWTFNELRKLAETTGVKFTKATLVAPPNKDPNWHDCLTFLLVCELGGLRATLLDNCLTGGKREEPYVRLALGNFHVTEPLVSESFEGVQAAVQKLLERSDVKKVVAGGGLEKLHAKLWKTVVEAVVKAGGTGTDEWIGPKGELPGYGQFKGTYTSETVTTVNLLRNKAVFETLKVDVLDGDFEAVAAKVVELLKAKKEDPKKKKKNTPLYQRLNDLNVTPVVEDGKVTALVDENEEALRTAELEELGLDPENLGSIQPHPEGADRGGYLPEVGGAQWDENNGEWQ